MGKHEFSEELYGLLAMDDSRSGNRNGRRLRRKTSSEAGFSTHSGVSGFRVKSGFHVARKGNPGTPRTKWKLLDMKQNSYAGNHDHLPGHYNSPRTHVSARKLAASLWELQEQFICGSGATQTSSKKYAHSQKRRINNLALGKEMRAQSITYPSSLASSTNSCSEATVQVKVSTIRGTSDRSPLPMIETVLMKLGAGGEVTTNELVKVFNHMWNLEERHSHTMSVISAMRAQVEEARAQLKDLLQKESTHSKEVEHVTKQIIEERALWKQQQEIHIQQAVRSIKEELDAVRKSKRKLEALYKGSIKELQDARKKMDKALKEIRKERRARELMEGICDELARKVGKDKAKVEELKRESLKVREEVEEERKMLQMAEVWREERVQMKLMEAKLELEEKNNAVNKLQSELEMLINAENKCDVKEEAAVSQYTYRHSLDLYSGQSFADIHQPHDKKSTDSVGNISGKGSSGGIEVGISDGEDDLHSIELKPSRDKLVQQYSMETNDSVCSANQPLHNKLSTEKPQQMARIDQDERKTRQDMKTRKKKFSRQSRVSQWIECNFKEGEMEWGAREHHVEEHLAREESSRLWQNIHESSVDPVCSPKVSKQVVGHEVGNLKPAWMKSSTLCEKIGDMFPQNKSDLHHDTFGFPDIQSHIVHGNQLKFFDMVPSPAHQWNHHWLPSSDVGTMSLRASMENSFQRKLFETKLEGQQQPWKMQC